MGAFCSVIGKSVLGGLNTAILKIVCALTIFYIRYNLFFHDRLLKKKNTKSKQEVLFSIQST